MRSAGWCAYMQSQLEREERQKEYERKGFHLQRLYKRRKLDDNGVYRPTMHTLMEKPVYPASLGNEDPNSPYNVDGGSWDE